MKAYKVSCKDDDHGAIVVFAERGRDVSRRANAENCDCPFTDVSITREPKCDQYAPGPMTIPKYLAAGWFWSCSGCGKLIYGDDRPLVTDSHAWCSKPCAEKSLAECEQLGPNRHQSFDAYERDARVALAAEAKQRRRHERRDNGGVT